MCGACNRTGWDGPDDDCGGFDHGVKYGYQGPFVCVECTELVLLFLALGLLAAVVFVSISIFFTLKVNGLLWQEVVQTSD